MKNKLFHKLKLKDYFYVLGLLVFSGVWINIDQIILEDEDLRLMAFTIVGLALMILLYMLINPPKWISLSNTLTILLIPIYLALDIVLHVFILKDGFQLKSLFIGVMIIPMIYLSGLLYRILKINR